MLLSLKNVYKQPMIYGDCSYESEELNCELKSDEGKFQYEKIVSADQDTDEVAFWSDPDLDEDNSDPSSQNLDQSGRGLEEQAGPDLKLEENDLETGSNNKKNSAQSGKKVKEDTEAAVISKAEKMLEERFDKSVKEGYEQGLSRAEEECSSKKEKAKANLREAELILREAKQSSKEIIASSERKIVELAMAVAERLVYRQLDLEPETITSIARETVNMLNEGTQVDLHVNPADFEKCLEYSVSLKKEHPDISKLEVLPDPQLPRGSCRVESESGVVEYLIDEEKDKLKEMLLKIARSEESRLNEEGVSTYERH